ncbi:MAG: PSD1 and planctomycete cytochrome C domain-containing protein [Isosphaeraceae bacterium]
MALLIPAFLFIGLIDSVTDGTSRPIDFSREVRPILSNYCFPCHGPDDKARKAKLRLDVSDGASQELSSGNRAIVPGRPEDSEAMSRLTTDDVNSVMPPPKFGKRPTAREVEVLKRWVEQGARYATHWAYVPPIRHALPKVSDSSWTINGIDHFILARLDHEGLRPSPPADRYALLRRVSLDLTGLPPSPAEVDRLAGDGGPDAYERAVDRLLAKPSYGERWAAVWLDLARYGDSSGYIHDPPRTIWRWRDWLIQAINAGLPYDRFTTEMLAGDLLSDSNRDRVVATGFHRNTTTNSEGGANSEEYRFASVVDRVNTTMQVWMGTTFGCAQCHNHKYDPFTQKEYYQVFAIFNNTSDSNSEEPTVEVPRVGREAEFQGLLARLDAAKRRFDEETKRADARRTAWEKAVDRSRLPKDIVAILAVPAEKRTPTQAMALATYHRASTPDWSAGEAEVKRLRGALDQVATTTLVMKEAAARPTHIAIRGEYQNRGEPVKPGLPTALHPARAGTKLDRLGLAAWLVDPRNPLTARVAVNRLWQEIFEVGIVETSEEFGMQGELPSHPELLGWLATEYIRLGWDTKRLLKLIVTSATYRQSSRVSDELARRDPYNRLMARGPRVRLTAEATRDQALAASGLLSTKMYGPPVHPFQPINGLAAAFGASTDWETSRGEDAHRRALYTRWRRNLPYPSMIAFDVPERAVCSVRRIRTNTPIQALVTLNDPVFVEAAQALGRRILKEGGPSEESRAAFGVRVVLSRPPTEAESRRLVALFRSSRTSLAADPARATVLATKPIGAVLPGMDVIEAAAWTVVGNVLLNLDETLAKR